MSLSKERVTADTEITFRIRLPEACPLATLSGQILSANPTVIDDVCHSEFVIRPSDEPRPDVLTTASSISGRSCLCNDIRTHGGVPVFERLEDGHLTVSLLLKSRQDAYSLYSEIREHVPDVEIVSIMTDRTAKRYRNTRKVDLEVLTEKQAQALTLAVCNGYYETPRDVYVESLASECGISRQAFSSRLRQAEAKILKQICPERNADPPSIES